MKKIIALVIMLGMLSTIVPYTVFGNESPNTVSTLAIPEYTSGYGFDSDAMTMYDHNGFAYSYMPDGIIKLVLPWGYTTYFSFGLTGAYLGVAQKITALSYTWVWSVESTATYSDENFTGYDYSFTATNSATLAWEISFDFFADASKNMKITHTVKNNYPNAITGVEFWYLFDLTHTPAPSVTTQLGTFYPPLYSTLPTSVTWARLSNQFQFDWRDAGYPNAHAYLGAGSIVGLPIDILGISLSLGDLLSGESNTIDPYFSGVTLTWAAAADGYSGIAANWSPAQAPATGDNITFDGTSIKNCTWNTTATVADFTMLATYTGITTNAASWGVNNFTLIYPGTGTFATGTAGTYTITCEGNFRPGYNRLTGYGLNLIMTGDNADLHIQNDELKSLHVSGAYVSVTHGGYWGTIYDDLTIDSGSVFEIVTGTWLSISPNIFSSPTLDNDGRVIGGGLISYSPAKPCTVNFGSWEMSSNLIITGYSACAVTMTAPGYVKNLRITSSGTGYYTLNMAGYSLATMNLTIESKGILSQSTGALYARNVTLTGQLTQGADIDISGAWAQTAGTFTHDSHALSIDGSLSITGASVFTPGTGEVTLSGSAKTLTTNAAHTFYDLTVSGAYTTTSSVNVSHDLTVPGTLTVGAGKYLDWNYSTGTYSNTGEITGTGTLYITLQDDYSVTLGTVSCPVIIRRAVGASGTQMISFAVDTSLENDLSVESNVILSADGVVVYFTSDMNLSMSADSTFENCTINTGVTLNLLNDLIIELRATIDGTVTGADLIQPPPAFTSSPVGTIEIWEYYEYPVTWAYWDSFSVVDCPSWMYYSDGAMVGTAGELDIGVHNVSLLLTWADMTTYQNFTVMVEGEGPYMEFDFFIYFIAMIILLATNIIGYVRIPILCLFGIFGVAILCVPTILAFGDYYWFALVLILMNIMVPIMATDRMRNEAGNK